MKSRINLVTPDLFPKPLRLSFDRMILAAIASVFLLVLIYVLVNWQVLKAQEERKMAQLKFEQVQQRHAQLKEQLVAHKPSEKLVELVNRKERQLELQQLLIRELSDRSALASQGFSGLLTDLASVHRKDLWLTEIYASEGHFRFEGVASSGQSLPLWIDQLSSASSLQGVGFSSISMESKDHRGLVFELTSVDKEAGQ
ncbi:PilN domain-containing protein [Paraferrimonas haliotis]|uniref:Uncharacterized protein n=1 Tax=Paraferrimonas haliotis TaxID=2013866 RepID=A0AA37TMT1_9GAMM|nr:PilN domain-containing protein [Paraferrimonas haliotis]GLS82335.1 hypothetical protein GCM10007894_03120 [Paraferrimonas haliotis]